MENYTRKKWISKGKTKIKYENNALILENNSNKLDFVILTKLFKFNDKNLEFKFNGEVLKGNAGTLKLLNRHKSILAELTLNSTSIVDKSFIKYYILTISVPANSKIKVTNISVGKYKEQPDFYKKNFKNDILVVTPGYPTLENKYIDGFVHSRVKAYKENGLNVDVACIYDYKNTTTYEYEDVKVFRSDFYHLRELLMQKKYKKIIVHFFDENYANVFDSVNLTETKLYFYCHGAETLYWDWNKLTNEYFENKNNITKKLKEKFKLKDETIKRYNDYKNVTWIFSGEWSKSHSEELIGLKYNNYKIIPNYIDTEKFDFVKKNPDLRKKIFVIRKMDNINTYSVDICVKVIEELSKRKIFDDLEFNIYGDTIDNQFYNKLMKPIEHFSNVHLHKEFLNHDQISEVHKKNGICLIPTRYDTQGVSACEAASSGCVVVSSHFPGLEQFISPKYNTLCKTENIKEYADVIEKLYNDQKLFLNLSKNMSNDVNKSCSFDATIKKELEEFKNNEDIKLKFKDMVSNPILTVIIPSYNVEKYLESTVMSIINHDNAHKMEVLIVNDGSKDGTSKIAKRLEKLTLTKTGSIVKLIDKENGGHGSTINKGVELAKGKYVKVIDGDDTVYSNSMKELIDILENEVSDIVLTDYCEDFAYDNVLNHVKIYDFMETGKKYKFDDLCSKKGFTKWGPILSTSSYKLDMLKKRPFKLLEKSFYVDMLLNTNVDINCETISYYPIKLYRYLIGRAGQSVNMESFKKNYKQHENVTIKIIETIKEEEKNLSKNRLKFLEKRIIIPMVEMQYNITIRYCKSGEAFREFDERLKKYPDIYNLPEVSKRAIRFYRKFNGKLVWCNSTIVTVKNIFKRRKK